jgi:segregation and condensation protein B
MIKEIIEAVLFASDTPVESDKIREIVDGLTKVELLETIDSLNREYSGTGRSFRIVEVAGGFMFETLPKYGVYIERLFQGKSRPRLSRASLETLAIVAYRQPVSKAEIDALRGVDSDASIKTLQNRDLIEEKGRGDGLGKPILYGTTQEFMRYFGLKKLDDLPGADELASMFDGSNETKELPGQLSLDTGTQPSGDADAAETT